MIRDGARPRSKTTDLFLFLSTVFHLATDPRDKIYALLGLMDLDIPVNYSNRTTVRDVYGAFTEKWVDAGSVSKLLVISGIVWNPVRICNLSSWVRTGKQHRQRQQGMLYGFSIMPAGTSSMRTKVSKQQHEEWMIISTCTAMAAP